MEDFLDYELPEYTKFHYLIQGNNLRVYWNLFTKPHREYSLSIYKSKIFYMISFQICFGIGKVVIAFNWRDDERCH